MRGNGRYHVRIENDVCRLVLKSELILPIALMSGDSDAAVTRSGDVVTVVSVALRLSWSNGNACSIGVAKPRISYVVGFFG